MYIHSIKVPRLYKSAAKFAKQVAEEGQSVKKLVLEKATFRVGSHYALVITTLQHSKSLDVLLRKTNILLNTPIDPWLARVLITELLWGKKSLKGESKPVKTILSYEKKFHEILTTEIVDDIKPKKVLKPKYVRVNTLKTDIETVILHFRESGWTFITSDNHSDYHAFIATVRSLGEDQFMQDFHIKELLIFPPKTLFYNNSLYNRGHIIIQDKASCLAVHLLNPPVNGVVLDMCAAPGMKTSQLSAKIGKNGKVYAIERSKERYETMQKLMEKYGVTNAFYLNGSAIDMKDFPDARYILVDPSCSGSGMVDRVEFEDPDIKYNKGRLETLASFQMTILRHALTKFPKVRRVVYSTCSINPEENENVVKNVLRTVKGYHLVPVAKRIKHWYSFGSKDYGEIGNNCLLANPEEDLTNGFFIAVFKKMKRQKINPYYTDLLYDASDDEGKNISEDEDKNISEDEDKNISEDEDKNISEDIKPDISKTIVSLNPSNPSKPDHLDHIKKKSDIDLFEQNMYDEYTLSENIKTEMYEELTTENKSKKQRFKDNSENTDGNAFITEDIKVEVNEECRKRKKSKHKIKEEHTDETFDSNTISGEDKQPNKKRKKLKDEIVRAKESDTDQIDDLQVTESVSIDFKRKNKTHVDENIDKYTILEKESEEKKHKKVKDEVVLKAEESDTAQIDEVQDTENLFEHFKRKKKKHVSKIIDHNTVLENEKSIERKQGKKKHKEVKDGTVLIAEESDKIDELHGTETLSKEIKSKKRKHVDENIDSNTTLEEKSVEEAQGKRKHKKIKDETVLVAEESNEIDELKGTENLSVEEKKGNKRKRKQKKEKNESEKNRNDVTKEIQLLETDSKSRKRKHKADDWKLSNNKGGELTADVLSKIKKCKKKYKTE